MNNTATVQQEAQTPSAGTIGNEGQKTEDGQQTLPPTLAAAGPATPAGQEQGQDQGAGLALSAPSAPVPAPPSLGIDLGGIAQVDDLSPEEYMALMTDEQIIQDEFRNSLDVGLALADIRRRKLYRTEYGTFPDYYRKKWQFDSSRPLQPPKHPIKSSVSRV